MTPRLRALGLALVALLAMSAIMACAASARFFHSEAETTTISGSQTTINKLKTTAAEVTCENASFFGTQTTKTSQSLRVGLSYTGCHIIISKSTIGMTVTPNGCEFNLKTTNAAGETTPELIIECPAGKKIQITGAGCSVEIGPQTLTGISYSNKESHWDVNANITGVAYNHSGFTCGTGSGNNGTYTGTITNKGTDTAGHAVKIWVE